MRKSAGYKPNHALKIRCSLCLHDDGPGFRLNDDPDIKLSSVG